jgi:hypothetical protein
VRSEPEKNGAAEGTRTPDPIITNDVLYQLSYSGILLCAQAISTALLRWVALICAARDLVKGQGFLLGRRKFRRRLGAGLHKRQQFGQGG